MNTLLVLEIIGVVFNIVFLLLLIAEMKLCWIFGILGSLLGSYVIYQSGYYSEALLYIFYAGVGVYGYIYWNKKSKSEFTIKRLRIPHIFLLITGGVITSLGLGYLMSKSDASKPYYDALSTVFGVMATFLELYKYIIAWGFWIVINGYSIWLYALKDLNFLTLQMALYFILSLFGLLKWKSQLKRA